MGPHRSQLTARRTGRERDVNWLCVSCCSRWSMKILNRPSAHEWVETRRPDATHGVFVLFSFCSTTNCRPRHARAQARRGRAGRHPARPICLRPDPEQSPPSPSMRPPDRCHKLRLIANFGCRNSYCTTLVLAFSYINLVWHQKTVGTFRSSPTCVHLQSLLT